MSNLKSTDYYRGNRNLVNENVKLEYEDWQLDEVTKCYNDPKYFINKYVKIVTPKGLEYFTLRPYQDRIIDMIHNDKRVVIMSGRQSGKCFLGNSRVRIRKKGEDSEGVEITIENLIEMIKNKNA